MENLHNKQTSVEFYDARYTAGYMEEWDAEKKRRVRQIIKGLPLPQTGKALDFGCGNGVFTAVLKECLPAWEVYGVEISKTAVANASKKNPDCRFFLAEEAGEHSRQFDLLFSHHVLEHVPDIAETFRVMDQYLKPSSAQLHILPCGNSGSFEYNVCRLMNGGIEADKNNRFFFEELGHLRRLTTDEFVNLEQRIGFKLETEFYANQYQGAINWITKSSPRFVKKFTDPARAVSESAKNELITLRKKLLPLTYYQFPYSKYWSLKSKWNKSMADRLKLAALRVPALFSKPIYQKLERLDREEWDQRNGEKNGSEMYLFFKRQE